MLALLLGLAVGVDYVGIALVVLMTSTWAGIAEVDGRHAVARHPWVWGLAGGAWTILCRFGWGHAPGRLFLDQLVLVAVMMAVLEWHERRCPRDA